MLVTVSQAANAVKHARTLELPIPAHVVDAEEARAEVARLAHTRPPVRPELPEDPGDIAAAVAGHATAVATHRQVAAVTREFSPDADTWFVRAVQASAADWCDAAADMYHEQVKRFTAARRSLPPDDGDLEESRLMHLTPKQFKHWQACDKAAHTLDVLVAARRDWERLNDHPAAGRWGRLGVLAHMAPPPDPDPDGEPEGDPKTAWQWVVWARRAWTDPNTGRVHRWAALVEAAENAPLVLAMPREGRLHAHAETFAEWLELVLAPVGKAVSYDWR